MGASGAGKTSLLNILCKRISTNKNINLSGNVCANNENYDFESFSQFAGYVMQDDLLLETMTVRECFDFVAKLKL
jgi:ABC-type multidrug transport system ATPase subunit